MGKKRRSVSFRYKYRCDVKIQVGINDDTVQHFLFPPGKYNLGELSEKIIEHFVYGLATIKGHKLIQKYNQQRQKKPSYEERK